MVQIQLGARIQRRSMSGSRAITRITAAVLLGTGEACVFAAGMTDVPRSELCVTEGEVRAVEGGRLAVRLPKMRAYVSHPSTDAAQLAFTYLGPTGTTAPLGSGLNREQLGLKLRSQDPCNLVYVMWRIEPKSQIVVSIKSNPGQQSSAQCANHGYRSVRPTHSTAPPALQPGQAHTVLARISGDELRAYIDGMLAWQGSLGPEVDALRGSVGVRTDNVQVEFALSAELSSSTGAEAAGVCKSGSGDAE
jgi:hypothetical protein